VETGEALGARRRNLVEEMPAITVSWKCWHRHQGGGSGRSTVDLCGLLFTSPDMKVWSGGLAK